MEALEKRVLELEKALAEQDAINRHISEALNSMLRSLEAMVDVQKVAC